MRALKSLRPAITMYTYVIESMEGVQKVNVPTTWTLKVEANYGSQNSTATIVDNRGSVRLSFTNVLSIRDTATRMQEALIDRDNNDEVTWENVETDVSLYRYAREASTQSFNRRNRTNNRENARRSNRATSAPLIDEPFYEDF